MLISNRMTRNVMSIGEDKTIREAADIMAHRRIHQLPVVRKYDRLVGIITDRDTRGVPEADRGQPVTTVMTANPITVAPSEPLEEALLLLHHHRFGSLPVVTTPPAGGVGDDALPRLVGIISHTDILAAVIEMLGVDQPGTRLEIDLPEATAGAIGGAVDAVAGAGARIISLVVSTNAATRQLRLYVRLSTINPRPAVEALIAGGYRIAEPYPVSR
ncbi:MAG: CBS domain-containing protein [Phycisphaerae bacterium]|nr:CBS domain-containing protein [Phycisphaerae bacterium]